MSKAKRPRKPFPARGGTYTLDKKSRELKASMPVRSPVAASPAPVSEKVDG